MRKCVPKATNLHAAKRPLLIKWHTFSESPFTCFPYCFLAPSRLEFRAINTHSISISAIHPGDASGIDHFEISVKDQPEKKCTTKSGSQSCDVKLLSPATAYTFVARACLAPQNLGACGDATEGSTWTRPTGELH